MVRVRDGTLPVISHAVGVRSRVRRGRAPRRVWEAPGGFDVELPLIVGVVCTDDTGAEQWRVDATIDLVNGSPTLVKMQVSGSEGLDVGYLQNHFRWASPVDIVSVTIPQLLLRGIDPFKHDLPVDGFPNAAYIDRSIRTRLTDEFLEEIAARYLVLGRGYAKAIALERNVSPRTAVSWVEKARERGILSATTPGVAGGILVSRGSGQRRRSRRS